MNLSPVKNLDIKTRHVETSARWPPSFVLVRPYVEPHVVRSCTFAGQPVPVLRHLSLARLIAAGRTSSTFVAGSAAGLCSVGPFVVDLRAALPVASWPRTGWSSSSAGRSLVAPSSSTFVERLQLIAA